MRKILLLSGGWCLVVVGIVLTPAPVPVPLIGVVPLLVGCAILSRHSKSFRRGLQRLRHRFDFISHWLEGMHPRFPLHVKTMIRRTRPHALLRLARMRVRRHN
jgi:Putative transmembrane protein (PGPGW)